MLREPRRLLSSAVAIVLGVAFVASALLLGDALNTTMRAAAAGTVGDAAVVVSPTSGSAPLATEARDAVRAVPGVAAVRGSAETHVPVSVDGRFDMYSTHTVPALSASTTLVAGRLPLAPGEVAVNQVGVDANGVGVGQVLSLDAAAHGPQRVTIVGVLRAGPDALSETAMPALFATDADALAWAGGYTALYVTGDGGPEALRAAVAKSPAVAASGATVRTGQDEVAARVDTLTQGTGFLVGVLVGFALIALFVSALVIANTFSILVAQRTRQLALLRCVGGTRGQVFRSVLGEALALAVAASLLGLGLGYGLASAAVALSRNTTLALSGIGASPVSLTVPVAAGVLVTLVAALLPARHATRISPMAALRSEAAVGGARPGVARLVLGALLVVGGAVPLAAGSLGWPGGTARAGGVPTHFLVAVGGGFVSFAGVLMLAALLVPLAARAVRPLVSSAFGVPGELASDNAIRNPRRAAATASALLVGVTLITLMSVGAASAQASATRTMDGHYPVDAMVLPAGGRVGTATLEAVRAAPGVERAAMAATTVAMLDAGDVHQTTEVYAVAPSDAGVPRNPDLLKGLADDTIVVPPGAKIPAGATVTLTPQNGGATLHLRAVVASRATSPALITPRAAAGLGDTEPQVWVRFADGVDAAKQTTAVGRAAAAATPGVLVSSAATERAQLQQIIDTALAVVVGLLAIAVVIALVGIANTLGLAVLERTQESGLLRALGVTRRQVRTMVALEAVTLALVAVLLGVALGMAYGVAGAHALFGSGPAVVIDVPWVRLGLVAGVALVAGWVASVLPAVRASRTSPAAALVAE